MPYHWLSVRDAAAFNRRLVGPVAHLRGGVKNRDFPTVTSSWHLSKKTRKIPDSCTIRDSNRIPLCQTAPRPKEMKTEALQSGQQKFEADASITELSLWTNSLSYMYRKVQHCDHRRPSLGPLHFTFSRSVFFRFILMLSPHIRFGTANGLITWVFLPMSQCVLRNHATYYSP